jgi:hypothetical protein
VGREGVSFDWGSDPDAATVAVLPAGIEDASAIAPSPHATIHPAAHYRPPGQTSWSRALVGADPRLALAAVLGVAAEDIQVGEAAGTGAGSVSRSPSPKAADGPLSVIRGKGDDRPAGKPTINLV